MLQVLQLELDQLSEEERRQFEELAAPCLLALPLGLPTIVIGAYWDGTPVGIAVATYVAAAKKGEIEQLFVSEAFRRRGVASTLLSVMETALRSVDCSVIVLTYPGDTPNLVALEQGLQARGWREPYLLLQRFYYNIYEFSPPWQYKPRLLPADTTLHSWSELTLAERHRLEVQATQGAYPYAVFPYGKGGEPEPLNSFFLRQGDRVIAWLATHRYASDTILYSGLYVHLDFRNKGFSLLLLSEGIKRHKASSVPMACFELNTEQVSTSWNSFVTQNLAPHAVRKVNVYMTWKELRELNP